MGDRRRCACSPAGARRSCGPARPSSRRPINATHRNDAYLPGVELPAGLHATDDLAEAVGGAAMLLVAVPSHGFRAVLEHLAPHVGADVAVVSLTKGIEARTNQRMSEVIGEVLPANPAGVLTGPNLAREIAEGQPAASVVALGDARLAELAQDALARQHVPRLHEHRRDRLRDRRRRQERHRRRGRA